MLSEADFLIASQGICPGSDLEWFAIDQCGNVGAFCNAGFASVPTRVFTSFELYSRAVEAVSLLKTTGDARWHHPRPPVFDTWDAWSQRGLFGYDWNHCVGQPAPSLPYRLMTYPEVPIALAALPSEVAAYISTNRLPVDDFSLAAEILI